MRWLVLVALIVTVPTGAVERKPIDGPQGQQVNPNPLLSASDGQFRRIAEYIHKRGDDAEIVYVSGVKAAACRKLYGGCDRTTLDNTVKEFEDKIAGRAYEAGIRDRGRCTKQKNWMPTLCEGVLTKYVLDPRVYERAKKMTGQDNQGKKR